MLSRLFAPKVGPNGKVIAVDIAQKFLDHIAKTCKAAGITNVETKLCKEDSVDLPPASVDLFSRTLREYRSVPFTVDTITLFSSQLNPQGAIHTPQRSFALS